MREAVALLEAREPNAKYLAAAELALVPGFELLATAQGGVTRLRQMILLLAVQGRLVARQEGDESANQALNRIRSAEARLIAEGKIKQAKAGSTISDDEVPFEIPAGWAWARLSQLTSILNGRAYSKQELLDAGTPVLRVGNLFTSKHWYYSNLALDEGKYCVAGDLLFAWSASFGPFIWPGPKVIYHYHIWKLSPHSERDLNKSYLYTFLLEKTQEIKASGHGVSMIHMTKEAMEKIVVPVPPLAEQHRIVARVEELMKLCDALEQSGRLADEQHARLTSTLFDALAASESAHALAENWQRVAEHFDLLLDRPAAIDALEQAILQLAVSGRLVAQEHTANLLPREPGAIESAPFELPSGWRWATMDEQCALITSGSRNWKNYYAKDGSTFVRSQDIKTDRLEFDNRAFVKLPPTVEGVRTQLQPRDVLITITGANVGKAAVLFEALEDAYVSQHVALVRLREPQMADFIHLWLVNAYGGRKLLLASSYGAKPGLNLRNIKDLPVPLPPLAEQRRIVARVEELRRLCADLRQRLTQAQETQSRLADSLVAEVA